LGGRSAAGDTLTIDPITPGTYHISEVAKAGYDITPSNPQTVVIAGCEPAEVTFTNTTVVTTTPPEVGGEIYPISKVAMLTPAIVLAIALLFGTAVIVRRRQTQR
jgi:hypothetical protein